MNNKPLPQRRLTKSNSTKAQRRAQHEANIALKPQKQPVTPRPRKPRRNKPNKTVDPYVVCRLNPFASKGSNGIPDGSQVRKLVVDHRQTLTLTFGSSGSIGIMFTPALPSCAWVRSYDATTQINGVATSSNSGGAFLIPIPVPEWAPNVITYNNVAGQFDDVVPLYAAARARIVSAAWQLMYAGTTLTNSGMVRVNTGAFTVDPPTPNIGNFTVNTWTGAAATTYATQQVFVRPVSTLINDLSFAGSGNNAETTLNRLSKGCHGIMRHTGKDYEFKEILPNATYLSRQFSELQSMLLNQSASPTTVGGSAVVQFFDNDWDTTFISITGGTAGQSVAFDYVFCVEYNPSPTSSIYSLAKTGRINNNALRTAEVEAGKMPNSQPGAFPSALASTVSTLSTIADVASAVSTIML